MPINLRSPNAHATRIKHSIRPPMDNGAILGGQFTIIAVAPDVVELRKIGTMVFTATVIIPKAYWHAWEGRLTDQFAFTTLEWYTRLIPKLDRHTQCSALNLARVNRARWATANKTRDYVSAARNRSQQHIGFELTVDVFKALMR